jgi:hypothetical protein
MFVDQIGLMMVLYFLGDVSLAGSAETFAESPRTFVSHGADAVD